MYKQFYSKLLLLVAMIVAGAGTSWAATYKLTKVTSVEAGSLYVFEQDGHVMNNTVSSSALQTTDSYSKTNLTGTETYVWTLETGDTNGCFYMKNVSVNDGYLYNGSSTGVSLSQNHSNWKFTFQNDETVLIQNSDNNNRFLGYSSTTSYAYKAYATSNMNSYPHAIVVYKLEEENGDTPSLTASDLSLTGTTNALSFDLFNNSDAQVLNYSTSSTGAVTVSENAYVTTIVDEANKTITVTPVAITPSEQTLTISQAADNNYAAGSVRFTVNITNNDPNAPGTANNPYTVTQARAAIDANAGVTEVYAKGIVSKIVTAFNSQYGNISYNISEDGTEEADQLEAYRGFSYDGEWFTSEDDIQVGDEVVIYGNLTKYGSTYEFAAGNKLVSLVRPQASQVPAINAEDVELAYDATSGEIAFTIDNPVEGYNVTVATPDVDWISDVAVSADANVITFTTTVNEGTEAREGHITINYGGTTVEARKVVKVTQGINENIQPVAVDGSYVKVTSTEDITDGQYLIVYEGNDTHAAAAFNGGLETLDAANNTIAITIENGEIAATDATKAAEFTIDVTAGTIKSASGLYIGKSGYSNGIDANAETQYENTFAITNDEAVITASGNCTLRYNYASDQLRFRYYKTGQQAIQLYKFVSNEPEVEYYLAGSFAEDGWDEGMLKMTNKNGIYSVTKEIEAETEFKIVKKDVDGTTTWYGGEGENTYLIHRDWCTDIVLVDGKNFIINEAGEYTFSVNTTGTALTLSVDGFPAQQFFMAGSFNDWSTTATQFEVGETEGVYTLTQELEAGAEFKVVSEGKWYGTTEAISAENCTALPLSDDSQIANMTVPAAGEYTFTLEKTPNGLFLSIAGFPEPVVTYYLAGSWNEWSEMVELAEQEDGSFVATQEFPANTEFKIVKDVNGAKTWFGGLPLEEGSEYYLVNKDWCTDIVLKNDTEVDGGYKNFKIEKAGDYTFKVSDEGEDGLFLDVAGWVVNYALVTDANQLEAGKEIIIVGENNGTLYALAEQKTNNRGAALVTKEKGIIAVNHSGSIPFITLDCIEGEAGTLWGFDTDDGYLYAASSSSNHLKTLRPTQSFTSDANAQATIEIAEDGQATIVFQGTNSHNDLRFNNDNSNNLLFSCYTSDKTYPHAYIYMETELDEIPLEVTITDAEWATYVAEDDVTFPDGVTAYVPTTISTTSVGLTQVTQAMKGEAVIVNGAAGTYQLAYAEQAISEKNADNKFEISDGTVSDGSQYVLSNKKDGIVGFYKVKDGVTIPTGKPYLVIENAAKDFVPFGGNEATGIETIDNGQLTIGDAYDLQGRKVQKLSKGIFIQNGRKIVVK